ncbi:MAG TPA: hypothetical protein VNV44_05005 [Solirubrobacteraceae bacterium]|nr:hypothetical protein [Solirubrobacteraceae bacterium]
MQRPQKFAAPLVLVALAAGALLPAAGGADAQSGCVVPDVTGVNLAQARHALEASGCQISVSQLPPHGSYVTPSSAEDRQLIRSQRPSAGSRASTVTVFAAPLCAQPALPGPPDHGARSSGGPTELVAALYLQGGPIRTSPHCRRGTPSAGTVVVSSPDGRTLVRRQVRSGNSAIFPLAPGRYVVGGTIAGGTSSGPVQVAAVPVTITARRTTQLDVVGRVH